MHTSCTRGGTCRPWQRQGLSAVVAGAIASRRSVVTAASKTPNYYDVLGVDVDASEEDIRTAYRKKAKQLHPDVNREDTADEQFKQAKVAYETLVDADKRRDYDLANRTRRLNFFQDVTEDDLSGWPQRPTPDPFEVHRKMWESDQRNASATGKEDTGDSAADEQLSPEEMLERLARIMNGEISPMRAWGSGRLDPFGSSSSEAWHRRVEEQTQNPGLGYRGRSLYNDSGDDWGRGGPSEWNPYRPGDDSFEKREGWSNPSRPEWQTPRRRWEDADDERLGGREGSGRGRGPGRGGIPGDGGFRGKPL